MAYYKLNQIDIYIVVFFAGASFFWIADEINKLPIPIMLSISALGTAVCAIPAQYASFNYWLYSILTIIMPVMMMMIFTMGLCKLKLQVHIENSQIYKWLLKHNMDIYLFQAPGMYMSFMILYPIIGKYCFLCIISCYIFTITFDFITVLLLTHIRSSVMKLVPPLRQSPQAGD